MRGKISECGKCYEVFKSKKLLNEHKSSCPRNDKEDDHDVIMLDEDDNLDVVEKVSDKIEEKKNPEKNVSIPKVTPEVVNENIHGVGEEMEEDVEEEEEKDDEIEIVQSNIYKFQGNLNYDQEVKRDVFQFQYFDDFEDNDDIVLLEDEEDEEESDSDPVEEEIIVPPEENLEKCEECDDLLQKRDLDSHMKLCHPVQPKKMKQFEGGNFFMLAC